MPLQRLQAIMRKCLPEPVFERLYRIGVAGYDMQVAMRDWAFYHRPRLDADERDTIETIKMVLPYTMVGRGGLLATYLVVGIVEHLEIKGCLVECGVAKGGSALLMLLASLFESGIMNGHREAWLFDSFEGLPQPTEEDGSLRRPSTSDRRSHDLAEGYCLGTYDEVQGLFDGLGFSRDRVHLTKGWFQDTLPEYRDKVGDIAVLRIDGDWYESTKCVFENLYDNVAENGYVIVDDYALVGCRKAFDEFFERRREPVPQVHLDGRGGGWFKK